MPDKRPRARTLDWPSIRQRLDMARVAADLLGPASGRRGERSLTRLWWNCPFHHDPNPSFCVEAGGKGYRCYGCGEHGDAATLTMKILNLTFPEAVRRLAGLGPTLRGPRRAGPSKPHRRPSVPDDNLPRDIAERLVDDGIARLWSDAGRWAIDYLMAQRGLSERSILAARLGLVDRPLGLPGRPRGLVIPWYVGGELALIKLRQPKGQRPKYRQVFIDPALHVGIYPDPGAVRSGRPLVVTEGEFDCLLLDQELSDFDVGVITLGSASARLTPAIRSELLASSPWIVAADADAAGDRFAAAWPARARRIRPPAPDKDWTEVHAGGWGRLRYWWSGWLGIRFDVPEEVKGEEAP